MKLGSLIFSYHFQNWLHSNQGLLIFLMLGQFLLNETGETWDFRAFSAKGRRINDLKFGMLIRDYFQNWSYFNQGLLISLIVVQIQNSGTCQIVGVFAFSRERLAWSFGILMWPDYIQTWLNFGHSFLTFLIFLTSPWLLVCPFGLWWLRGAAAIG